MGGLVTAVTELADDRLVMMLDVEKVLSETTHIDDEHLFTNIQPVRAEGATVLFADDSSVARKQIQRTLDAMKVPYRRRNQWPPGLGRTRTHRLRRDCPRPQRARVARS